MNVPTVLAVTLSINGTAEKPAYLLRSYLGITPSAKHTKRFFNSNLVLVRGMPEAQRVLPPTITLLRSPLAVVRYMRPLDDSGQDDATVV